MSQTLTDSRTFTEGNFSSSVSAFFLLKISLLEMLIIVGNEHLKIICKWGIPGSSGCKRKKGAAGVPSPGDCGYAKGIWALGLVAECHPFHFLC